MPTLRVVVGGKPPNNPDEEHAYQESLAALRRLQTELSGEVNDPYSLCTRKAAMELALERGIDVAILVLRQELAELEEIRSS
jgi:predicted N-formylglutamate amidohydrolase